MIDTASIPTKGNKTASRVVDDEALVFHSKAGEVRVLNKVGTTIWELIDGKRSIIKIAQELSDKYDVAADIAEKDACDFIDTLLDLGLIKLGKPPSA